MGLIVNPERTNYSGIPAGMLIESGEFTELQKRMAVDIVIYGMSFSRGKIMDATSVSLQVAGQRPVFIDRLSYAVFGRIVKLSSECPEEKREVCVSVKFARELGEFINRETAVAKKSPLKGVDFTQEEGVTLMWRAFNSIKMDALFTQFNKMEMDQIRKIVSVIIPDNPKPERRPSDFPLD